MILKAVIQSFRLSRCRYVFSDSDITISQGAKDKTLPFKDIIGITPFGLVAPVLSGGRVKDLLVECGGHVHFIKDLPDCSLIVPILCERIAKARNLKSPYDVIGLSQDKERLKKRFKL